MCWDTPTDLNPPLYANYTVASSRTTCLLDYFSHPSSFSQIFFAVFASRMLWMILSPRLRQISLAAFSSISIYSSFFIFYSFFSFLSKALWTFYWIIRRSFIRLCQREKFLLPQNFSTSYFVLDNFTVFKGLNPNLTLILLVQIAPQNLINNSKIGVNWIISTHNEHKNLRGSANCLPLRWRWRYFTIQKYFQKTQILIAP